jgi:hypothetical protein
VSVDHSKVSSSLRCDERERDRPARIAKEQVETRINEAPPLHHEIDLAAKAAIDEDPATEIPPSGLNDVCTQIVGRGPQSNCRRTISCAIATVGSGELSR